MRADYMRQLRAENERAADIAAGQLDRIAAERAEVDVAAGALEARLAEWDTEQPADAMLDWWNELGGAIRGEVAGASSVADANTALRERFAAIFTAVDGDSVRLDFVLRERGDDDPLVSSRLWADATLTEDGSLVDFIHQGPPQQYVRPVETGRSTFV